MAEPFLGQIMIAGFNFPPRGYAQCDGQLLPINQNQSLYSLLGTTYGGDGRTNFALPELRGRTPIHSGAAHPLGEKSGEESHQLQVSEIPSHNHTVRGTDAPADQVSPAGNLMAQTPVAVGAIYSSAGAAPDADLANGAVSATGGQPHNNMQPFLALNYCIALQGLFPSRN